MKDTSSFLSISAVFAAAAIYIQSHYVYLVSDQFEQVPLIFRAMNASYLSNDWYVNANSGISVRYFYTQLIAELAKYSSVQDAMYWVFVISILASAFLIYGIGLQLFKNRVSAVFGTILTLFSLDFTLGGSQALLSLTTPTTVSIPFVLLAYWIYLKGDWRLAMVSLGIATWFQPLWGLLGAGILLFTILYTTKNLQRCVLLGLEYTVFAIPGILVTLASSAGNNPLILDTILLRHAPHYLPSAFHVLEWLIFGTLYILCWILVRDQKDCRLKAMYTAVSGILVLGYLFTEILPVGFIIKMQVFKATWFVVLIAMLLIGNKLAQYFKTMKTIQEPFSVILVLAFLFTGVGYLSITSSSPLPAERPELYTWIQQNTRDDAVFMIPPDWEDFRVNANRAIIVDEKAFSFKDTAVLEYRERLSAITKGRFVQSSNMTWVREGYDELSLTKKLGVAEKYGADYLITENDGVVAVMPV